MNSLGAKLVGIGVLDWSRVHKLIVKYLSDIKHLTFYIYGPNITN